MSLNRREAILGMLFGAGLVGLRSLATGIPAAILLDPRKAFAGAGGASPSGATKPQFLIFSTTSAGDPVNCNAPGTYDDPNIGHPSDPSMVGTPIQLGAVSAKAGQVWTTLPASVL